MHVFVFVFASLKLVLYIRNRPRYFAVNPVWHHGLLPFETTNLTLLITTSNRKFAEMSGDMSRICDIIAHDLARIHVSYYNNDAKRTKGRCRQRIQKAGGHTAAHRGWACLLLVEPG